MPFSLRELSNEESQPAISREGSMASGNAVMKDALSTTYSQAEILLNSTTLNKGTAFNAEERARFGLDGRLPPQIETLEEQVHRAYEAFGRKNDDLERHIYLRALQDTNEVLFYRVLLDHLEEMLPIIYTPVVAQGCRHFSQIYRRPRGLFIPYTMRNSIRSILRSRQNREA